MFPLSHICFFAYAFPARYDRSAFCSPSSEERSVSGRMIDCSPDAPLPNDATFARRPHLSSGKKKGEEAHSAIHRLQSSSGVHFAFSLQSGRRDGRTDGLDDERRGEMR